MNIVLRSKLLVRERLAIGSFIIPLVVVGDSSGYKVVSSHFQFSVAVLDIVTQSESRRNN
jgi:hypothetical protein